MSQDRDRANFNCPRCESSDVYRVNGSNRFKCEDCGQTTLEQVGEKRELLEDLAASDLAIAEKAELLLRGGSE